MADFSLAYATTSAFEGGYANDPLDRGGETYKGIARNIHPDWQGWSMIDSIKARTGSSPAAINSAAAADANLQNLVDQFYKKNFWDSLNLDNVADQRMAGTLYDTAVNMGTGTSAVFFQRILNAATNAQLLLDGKIGTVTTGVFNALSANDKYMVWKMFNCLRGAKYISIIEANPSQKIFLRSWASRIFSQ